MAGAIEPVNTYLASHENNAFGGFYHRPKKANSSYFNYGSLIVPEVLMESPIHDTELSRDRAFRPEHMEQIFHKIDKNHQNAIHLGNNYYHANITDEDYFYHKHDNLRPDAVSIVSDNVHSLMWKHQNTDKHVPLTNFQHALSHHGHLLSDNRQSSGAVRFWETIHDKFPSHKITLVRANVPVELEVNKATLEHNHSKIWGNSPSHDEIRLKIYGK